IQKQEIKEEDEMTLPSTMGGGYLYFCSFYGPGSGLLGLSPDTRDRVGFSFTRNGVATPTRMVTTGHNELSVDFSDGGRIVAASGKNC
nr:hypothetical protein [Tanacetum cinerariifolium]